MKLEKLYTEKQKREFAKAGVNLPPPVPTKKLKAVEALL
jgi:hypothetical protein